MKSKIVRETILPIKEIVLHISPDELKYIKFCVGDIPTFEVKERTGVVTDIGHDLFRGLLDIEALLQ